MEEITTAQPIAEVNRTIGIETDHTYTPPSLIQHQFDDTTLREIRDGRRLFSKECFEFFHCESRISGDSTHRMCIHWVGSRYGENTRAVGHDNVFALSDDTKAGLL